jgi:hypothetical protein
VIEFRILTLAAKQDDSLDGAASINMLTDFLPHICGYKGEFCLCLPPT